MIRDDLVTGIVLVAGNSTRFGKNRNKNFELINGKAVMMHSIEAFCSNKYIDDIIIAAKENEISEIKRILSKKKWNKEIKIVIGGSTRKESVFNCLVKANSNFVVIHDGARPMIKQEYINKCVESMNEFEGAAVGVKSKDTVKITNEEGIVLYSTERKNTWLSHTPQCFKKDILLEMHKKFLNDEVTDDCQLLEKGGYKVRMIEGDYSNIKITAYDDLEYVKSILMQKF